MSFIMGIFVLTYSDGTVDKERCQELIGYLIVLCLIH
jgi:hypothetical protein